MPTIYFLQDLIFSISTVSMTSIPENKSIILCKTGNLPKPNNCIDWTFSWLGKITLLLCIKLQLGVAWLSGTFFRVWKILRLNKSIILCKTGNLPKPNDCIDWTFSWLGKITLLLCIKLQLGVAWLSGTFFRVWKILRLMFTSRQCESVVFVSCLNCKML